MTYEEAIEEIRAASDEELKYGDKSHHAEDVENRINAFEIARIALEKQIPKKPIIFQFENDREPVGVICSECGKDIIGIRPFYCHSQRGYYCWNCGQRIDWGDEK